MDTLLPKHQALQLYKVTSQFSVLLKFVALSLSTTAWISV